MDKSCGIPKTNDISNPLLKKMRDAFATQKLTDITLVVGGKSFPVHRLMLSIFSDVFQTLFMNSTWSDSSKDVIELQEFPQCIEVFPDFLQYFYTGVITLNYANIIPIIMLADKYMVKCLLKQCIDYMSDKICDAANKGQLVTWFQCVLSLSPFTTGKDASYYCRIWQATENLADKVQWGQFIRASGNFIKWNLPNCEKCFNTFECNVLIGLLQQSDLVVYDEWQLFLMVVSWLEYQSAEKLHDCNDSEATEEYMESLTTQVMSYIRYSMISPQQLAELIKLPIFQKYSRFFFCKIAASLKFYTMPILEKCTPRLYIRRYKGRSLK